MAKGKAFFRPTKARREEAEAIVEADAAGVVLDSAQEEIEAERVEQKVDKAAAVLKEAALPGKVEEDRGDWAYTVRRRG